jgi:hypothetical protein
MAAALFPLMVYYSAVRQDNAVVATAASAASLDSTFAYYATDLGVPSNASAGPAPPGTVPLNFYFNAASGHHMTTASPQGNAFALANGFALQRVEGWVFPAAQAGLLPLTMYFSQARGDHFLVGTAQNAANAQGAGYVVQYVDCYVPSPPAQWTLWPDSAPAGIIFPKSADLLTYEFDANGNAVPSGIGADTWYPSWSADGNLYSSWTDGNVDGHSSGSGGRGATTGYATVLGEDPFSLTLVNVSTYAEPADPYEGRYPSLNFHHGGVWYYVRAHKPFNPASSHAPSPTYRVPLPLRLELAQTKRYLAQGTYSLENYGAWPSPAPNCGNWCIQGFVRHETLTPNAAPPRAHPDRKPPRPSSAHPLTRSNYLIPPPHRPLTEIRYSLDGTGLNWTSPRREMKSYSDNIFGETAFNNSKVKFGAPHAVDFGQENGFSPDGRLYIIGHGAETPESHQSWMQGDSAYMARTAGAPSPATINDVEQWQFWDGADWAPGAAGVAAAKPLFVWPGKTGVVTMSWHNVLQKYIIVISTPSAGCSTVGNFDTYFLESDAMTGPFSYVSYLSAFGPEAYFVHVPTKFMGAETVARGASNGPAQRARDERVPRGEALVAPLTAEDRTAAAAAASDYNFFLSYSADFASGAPNPAGSGYHWSLLRSRFSLSAAFEARLAAGARAGADAGAATRRAPAPPGRA